MSDDPSKPGPKPGTRHAGMFAPGVSGNPGGQRRVQVETRRAAADESPRCIERLAEIRDRSRDPHAVVAACKLILAYGIGRPVQQIAKTVTHVKRTPRELSLEELEQRIAELSRGAEQTH